MIPPYWLIARAREMRRDGVSLYEAPTVFIRESAKRISGGDLETAYWEQSMGADIGMGLILSLWRGDQSND